MIYGKEKVQIKEKTNKQKPSTNRNLIRGIQTNKNGKKTRDGIEKIYVIKKSEQSMRQVAVINPHVPHGSSLVNVLARSGIDVTVIVQHKNNLKSFANHSNSSNMNVVVADSLFGAAALSTHLRGCDRVFIMHIYLEKFENKMEEQQALTVFDACKRADVPEVVFTTLEALSGTAGVKSQIVSIYNAAGGAGNTSYSFEKMKHAKQYGNRLGVKLTHMFLSCIEAPNLIATSVVQENDGVNRVRHYQADSQWREQLT